MGESEIADLEGRHVGKDEGGILATQRRQQLEKETVHVMTRELLEEMSHEYFGGDECEDGRPRSRYAVEERQQPYDRQLLQPLEFACFVNYPPHSYLRTFRSSDTHTRRSEGADRHPPRTPPPPCLPDRLVRC